MGYSEFSHVLFRGALGGATGTADFVLTADAVDAVDTINIKNGAIAYQQSARFAGNASYTDKSFLTLVVPILDEGVTLEISAYASRLKHIEVAGVSQARYNSYENCALFPVVVITPATKGVCTIELIGNSTGSTSGWLNVRYIRRSGSEND